MFKFSIFLNNSIFSSALLVSWPKFLPSIFIMLFPILIVSIFISFLSFFSNCLSSGHFSSISSSIFPILKTWFEICGLFIWLSFISSLFKLVLTSFSSLLFNLLSSVSTSFPFWLFFDASFFPGFATGWITGTFGVNKKYSMKLTDWMHRVTSEI